MSSASSPTGGSCRTRGARPPGTRSPRPSCATTRTAAACCCLGLDAPPDELEASFALAARQPVCKGFAIGRTIFGAPARAWMRGEIDDETAIAAHGRDLRGPDRGLGARPRPIRHPPFVHPTGRARGRVRVTEMIKFAVLGCGRIGRMHALNLARHPRADLAYVYDVAEQAAAATAEATGARRAAAIDEILGAGDVDAVLIASSTDTHLDLLVRAVEAGKAVLCEKPIDLDLAKVDACWARIQRPQPDHHGRLQPPLRRLLQRAARAHPGRRDRQARAGRDHQPRPWPAADRLHRGLGRPVSRHDHPRLRHGALPDGRHRGGARHRCESGRPGDPAGRRHRRRHDHAGRRERRALPDQQQQALRLRLRPAGRGVRREGHAPGRQPASDHGVVLGCRRDRGPRPGPQFLHRALHAGLYRRDRSLRRLRRAGQGAAASATATGARRCAWPMPRSRACAPGRRSGSTRSADFAGDEPWPICCSRTMRPTGRGSCIA